MVGPTPEHDRSGNARAFYELSAQSLAALSDSQLPSLGPLGPLSIERRLRISRPVARCHGPRARCADTWPASTSCARPHGNSWKAMCSTGGIQSLAPASGRGSVTIFSGFPSSPRITFAPPATPQSSIRWFHSSTVNHWRNNRPRAFPFRSLPPRKVLCWNIAGGPSHAPPPPVRMGCL